MKNSILTTVFLYLALFSSAQDEIKPMTNFIGIQPMIKVSPYSEFYSIVEINMIPIVYERIISSRIGFKSFPILNYQINPEKENSISHCGFGISFPFYFQEREKILPYSGLFVSPHLRYTYNQTDLYNSLTYAAEFGWNFLINEKLALMLDLQYGRSIIFNSSTGKTIPHIGGNIQFGVWL